MKTAIMFALSSVLFASACAMGVDENDINSDGENSTFVQKDNVYMMSSSAMVMGGKAKLERGDDFEIEVESTVVPGDVYTAWLCSFVTPENCTSGGMPQGGGQCSGADKVAGGFSCSLGGGGIADASGSLEIKGYPEVSDSINADSTEFHIILRTHGQEIPGLLEEQLTTLQGGCDINACANTQYAVFEVL